MADRPDGREHSFLLAAAATHRPKGGRAMTKAEEVFTKLAAVGVDMEDVGRVLEEEGVTAFSKSFDELIGALERKSAEFSAGS